MYNTPEELRKSQTGVHLITFIPFLKLTDFDKYNGKSGCFLHRIEFGEVQPYSHMDSISHIPVLRCRGVKSAFDPWRV